VDRVLTSLGYIEMASAVTLIIGSSSVVRWTEVITIFMASDIFLEGLLPQVLAPWHIP
jgi:hypothetical protein